jgi:hypothetical protein
MNRPKKYLLVGLLTALVICGVSISIYNLLKTPQLLSVQMVKNLGLASFSNGETQVIFHDYDYAKDKPGWDLRTTIPAVTADDGRQLPKLVPPPVVFRSSSWQHEIYTYANEWNGCQQNILYINRAAKARGVIQTIPTNYCLLQTLNEAESTTFLGTNTDTSALVIGSYLDGQILATTPMLEPQAFTSLLSLASDPQHTQVAFISGQCNPDSDSVKIYVWDTRSATLVNRRPELSLDSCNEPVNIIYNPTNHAFDVYGENRGQSYIIGSIK